MDKRTTALPTQGSGEGGAVAQAPMALEGPVRVRPRRGLVTASLALSDILLAALFWGLAFAFHSFSGREVAPGISVTLAASTIAVWIAVRAVVGLYPGYGMASPEVLRRQTYATVATLAITAILAFGLQVGGLVPRLLLSVFFLECLVLAPVARYFVKWGLAKLEWWGKPVTILGAGETGKHLVQTLRREWGLGLRPAAVFDFQLAPRGGLVEGVPYGGTVADALEQARQRGIDTIVFAMPNIRREYLAEFVSKASRYFRHVLVVPNLIGITNSAVAATDLGGTFAVGIKYNLLDPWSMRAKRVLDVIGAVLGGLLISPLLLSVVMLIKLESRGPAFYRHARLGREGKHFFCWKFRTMHADAAQMLTELLQRYPVLRKEWEQDHKLRNDPRCTRIGHFLRKTSLDELPQLWNVLRGEMSLVGPRPIVDAEVPKYQGAYELYQLVGPGLTGLWQVSGRNNTTYEERVSLDSYYVRNWSIWMDFIILARTVKSLIFTVGAY